jgi:hypothetical protein
MDLTIKEYAKAHKMSLYQVIKKLQTGELQGYSKEVNGKRVQFIRVDQPKASPTLKTTQIKKPTSSIKSEEKKSQELATKEDILLLISEVKSLKEEIKLLKAQIKALRDILEV